MHGRQYIEVVIFLQGDSLPSEIYVPTLRNTLLRLHRRCKLNIAYENGTVCSKMSAHTFQMLGNHPKEGIQQDKNYLYSTFLEKGQVAQSV